MRLDRLLVLLDGSTLAETAMWTTRESPTGMSTHGRSGVGRLIVGSVAESVLCGTTVPIMIVRTESAPVDVPGGVVASTTDRPVSAKK